MLHTKNRKHRESIEIACQWWIYSLFKTSYPVVILSLKIRKNLTNLSIELVNFLPVIAKIYGRLMHDQMFNILIKSSLNFNAVFAKYLALRNRLLYMIKNWKESLDQVGHCGAPKAFDCMIHGMLLVKLQAYGFDNDFLNYNFNYLLGRKQKTKIKLSFSSWSKIEYGVLRGFILGPYFSI